MRLLDLPFAWFTFAVAAAATIPAARPAVPVAPIVPVAAPVAAPAAPAAPEVRLLLSATGAAPGDWVTGWLALKPGRVETLTLVVPRGVTLAWPDAATGCGARDPAAADAQTIARQAIDVPDGMIPFCVRPHAEVSFRVLAHLAYVPTGGTRLTDSVESKPVDVRDAFELGPVATTMLSTLVGFIAGLGTLVLQRQLDQRADKAKTRRAIEARLVEALEPDISKNVRAIEAFLADKTAAVPTLETGGFDLISKDVLAFLDEGDRAAYLARLKRLYAAWGEFSTSVNLAETRDKLEKKARAILDRSRELRG